MLTLYRRWLSAEGIEVVLVSIAAPPTPNMFELPCDVTIIDTDGSPQTRTKACLHGVSRLHRAAGPELRVPPLAGRPAVHEGHREDISRARHAVRETQGAG